jgi:1-acyl-sn-glycerol-3-phosphate acyltransferase
MSRRVVRRPREPWYGFAAAVLRPPITAVSRKDWHGAGNLPREGGVIVVPNHISHVDPLVVAHFLYNQRRPARFLAKSSLFEVPFVRRVMRGAGQIPTYRETRGAGFALRDAVSAVRAGEVVVVYAEGTLTRDPKLWPMAGKTGAARIAFETGAPVLPMAVWGAQHLLPPYSKRPHLWPRTTNQVWLGSPVELADLEAEFTTATGPRSGEILQRATDRIMDAVTTLLADVRGEPAPAHRLDPRAERFAPTGDAHVRYDLGDRSRESGR